jgi:hypothetical protein
MGRVRDELALGPHRALDPVGHLVEGVPELLHLAGALYLPGSSRQVARP